MKIFTLIFATLLVVSANAEVKKKDMGLDDIMDAYLMAKADVKAGDIALKDVEAEPYTVQVAAYLSEKDAVRHVSELKKSQKDVYYFTNFARGQVWYKVCVGRFKDVKSAEKYRKGFVKKMEEPFAVVIALKGDSNTRNTASVAKKEKTKLPIEKSKAPKNDKMQVKTMKKKEMVVAANTPKKAVGNAAVATAKAVSKKNVTDFLYALQIGAYKSEKEAQEKAKSMSIEQRTYVVPADVNGTTWYRVLVGSFETKREAVAYKTTYSQQTKDNKAFIKRLSK